MLIKNCDVAITVSAFQQMGHLMDDNILEQVLRLLHSLSIESDVPGALITATPFSFHPLKEVTSHPHL